LDERIMPSAQGREFLKISDKMAIEWWVKYQTHNELNEDEI
jgi:hypothetical protein